ncbi:hypothetical protein K1719_019235 [Acacia pycnantha]|nr:hypothetical protein K1719_019235 [Acacia pycnantha]
MLTLTANIFLCFIKLTLNTFRLFALVSCKEEAQSCNCHHSIGYYKFLVSRLIEKNCQVVGQNQEKISACCHGKDQIRAYAFWVAFIADGSLAYLCGEDLCQVFSFKQQVFPVCCARQFSNPFKFRAS